jgi:hypothetical protein
LISEVVRKVHDLVTLTPTPRANNDLQIRGPLLFVSSAGLGVPIYFVWILDGYLKLAGGEVDEMGALQASN